MHKRFLHAALLLLVASARAQNPGLEEINFERADTIQGIYQASHNRPYVFIATSFGSNALEKVASLDSVSGFLISEVVLVYSEFRKAESFSQQKLNAARWQRLFREYPGIFSTGNTRYRNVCQAGVQSDTAARQLTHGFYIYFENRADEKKRNVEIAEISSLVTALGIDTSETVEERSSPAELIHSPAADAKHSRYRKPMRTIDPKACRQPFYEGGTDALNDHFKEKILLTKKQLRKRSKLVAEVKLRLDYSGIIRSASIMTANKQLVEQLKGAISTMKMWKPAIRNGITIKCDLKFTLSCDDEGKMVLHGNIIVPRTVLECGTDPDEKLFDFTEKKAERSLPTVFDAPDKQILRDVIEREPAIDTMLLVVDLTGSMGPYIYQVLDLMADLVTRNDPYVACISLFNDGNNKPDKSKVVGSTGGIIVLHEDITLESLGKAILKSMKRGNGGDVMENNLEAVKKGIEKCPECTEIVMIADNFATPRDGSLVNEIGKPIHWILCGVYEDINVRYLDLVRSNAGILHTGKSDVRNLHLMKENGTIVIDGYTYQLQRGKFRVVKVL
jgi:hypothetical protein